MREPDEASTTGRVRKVSRLVLRNDGTYELDEERAQRDVLGALIQVERRPGSKEYVGE